MFFGSSQSCDVKVKTIAAEVENTLNLTTVSSKVCLLSFEESYLVCPKSNVLKTSASLKRNPKSNIPLYVHSTPKCPSYKISDLYSQPIEFNVTNKLFTTLYDVPYF